MTRVLLVTLAPGARFRVADRVGTLRYANACRALVQFDADTHHVSLADGTEFDRPGRPVSIAPNTEVEPIETNPHD